MFRESGGAFGVREAAMEEQYFRRLVYFTLLFGIYILKSTVKVMISSSVVSQFLLEFARGSTKTARRLLCFLINQSRLFKLLRGRF